jgi:hypothetical protein
LKHWIIFSLRLYLQNIETINLSLKSWWNGKVKLTVPVSENAWIAKSVRSVRCDTNRLLVRTSESFISFFSNFNFPKQITEMFNNKTNSRLEIYNVKFYTFSITSSHFLIFFCMMTWKGTANHPQTFFKNFVLYVLSIQAEHLTLKWTIDTIPCSSVTDVLN